MGCTWGESTLCEKGRFSICEEERVVEELLIGGVYSMLLKYSSKRRLVAAADGP